jgi:hypothetical protein
MIKAISQWYNIPIGVLGWPYFVLTNSYKLYQETKIYDGPIGSSDMDDPFTQEEKIGSSKSKPSKPKSQRSLEKERDYSEEIGQDTRREAQREYTESRLEGFSIWPAY